MFLFGITRKKKLFQFYRLLKSVFLFSITRKKKIVSVLQVTQIFVSVRYYKKKKILLQFFSVCIISATGYTNFCFYVTMQFFPTLHGLLLYCSFSFLFSITKIVTVFSFLQRFVFVLQTKFDSNIFVCTVVNRIYF